MLNSYIQKIALKTGADNYAIADANLVQFCNKRMNIIKFIAMCSVVWGHCIYQLEHQYFHKGNDQLVQAVMLQIGRVGTVAFLMVTGYLMSTKIANLTIGSYLRSRFRSLILPWVVFLAACIGIEMLHTILATPQHISAAALVNLAGNLANIFVFHSAYWFIPASIFASLILIAFKKYINSMWFGVALVTITLFYSVNLYHNWISANHTRAFLGYVFFMWLGIQIRAHIHGIKRHIDNIPWAVITGLLIVTFFMACEEEMKLTAIGSVDPYASIRSTNFVFSILLFLSIIKTYRMGWIDQLKPQSNIYGVYLIHPIIINEILPYTNKFISYNNFCHDVIGSIITQTFIFALIFSISYLLIISIRRLPFKTL